MTISALASQPAYVQHVQPIWDALPAKYRGELLTGGRFDKNFKAADLWLVAGGRDALTCRHRAGRVVMMEHGCGLQWYGPQELAAVTGADHVFAPNDFIAGRYKAAQAHDVRVIGTPKMDELSKIAREPGEPTIAVSFHWSEIQTYSDKRKLWRWYVPALQRLRDRQGVQVLGHAHPRVDAEARGFYRDLGIEYVPDFADVIRRADVYCCDHSSTIFEWVALDRPVVILDRHQGRDSVPFSSGLLYEQHRNVGDHVNPDTLEAAALHALEGDPGRAGARRIARDQLYPYLGESTARAVRALRALQ